LSTFIHLVIGTENIIAIAINPGNKLKFLVITHLASAWENLIQFTNSLKEF
jgi:hypothetical protein